MPQTKKAWVDYTPKYQKSKQKILAKEMKSAPKMCDTSTFIPTQLHLKNKETNETVKVDLETELSSTVSPAPTNKPEISTKALYIKDKFAIPDRTYRELSLLTSDLPSHHQLKQLSKEIDSTTQITSPPEGIIGVQQKFRDRLITRLNHMLKKTGTLPNKLLIILSGDGTNIARSMHVINFTFTVLNDVPEATTTNHTLAILKATESYNELRTGLSDLTEEMEEMQQIEHQGKTIEIEYFLAGDWKFLALVTGIGAANSNYPCIWCKCSKEMKYDMNRQWSITDQQKGARTISEALKYGSLAKSKQKFSYQSNPIFPFIPTSNVIIDSLHLFLRIGDNLINLLITELL